MNINSKPIKGEWGSLRDDISIDCYNIGPELLVRPIDIHLNAVISKAKKKIKKNQQRKVNGNEKE